MTYTSSSSSCVGEGFTPSRADVGDGFTPSRSGVGDKLLPYLGKNLTVRKPLRLPPDAYDHPDRWYFITICAANKQSIFASPAARDLLVETLRSTAEAERADILAYVVMPNHVHFISSCGQTQLGSLVRRFKGVSTKFLREQHGLRNVWQRSFFDHVIRSNESLEEKHEYIRQNPVRRGLIGCADDYPWYGSINFNVGAGFTSFRSDVGEGFTPSRPSAQRAGWDKPIPYTEKSLSNIERRASRGFTLIELLTVMAIIVVLAGLTMGLSSYANRKALESRAKAEIRAMELALEAYKADNGGYPPLNEKAFLGDVTSTEGYITNIFSYSPPVPPGSPALLTQTNGWTNSQFIYRALTQGSKKYMSFRNNQIATVRHPTTAPILPLDPSSSGLTNKAIILLDPLGYPYGYAPRGPVGHTSAGATNQLANPQNFDLWSAGLNSKSDYPTNLTLNVDDIGNWQK